MQFEKDTIMGLVLNEVNTDDFNQPIIEDLKTIITDIDDGMYEDYTGPLWNKNGLYITDLETDNPLSDDKSWIFISSEYAFEYSWLVFELEEVYKPSSRDAKRLYTTIGYLIEVYEEKYNNLEEILKFVVLVSSVWLHPDHLGLDRFIVHPINLPDFGPDY